MTLITMSQKEIDRYDIIKRLIRKEMNGTEASKLLSLSTRQIRRLKSKVEAKGAKGLIHRNRGGPGNRSIPKEEKSMIVQLIKTLYSDFRPTLASEKLNERNGIKRDPKTIRKIMIEEKLWKPKRAKKGSIHRSWRQRRAHFGEMQQFDGSYHDWFEGRLPKACLLASVDDATGKITKAEFAEHEGVTPVFKFWKSYLKEQGKPRSIYLDKFSTYKMNPRFAEANHDLLTQFQRAMKECNIEPISAHSAEAKGRVERVFETLQDRLVKEMRLEGISTIEEANRFLRDIYIPRYNAKFAVKSRSDVNLHRPLSKKEIKSLEAIFSRHYQRVVNNDFTISFKNTWYQLIKDQPVTVCKKDKVLVEERLDGAICIRLKGKYLSYIVLPERPKKMLHEEFVLAATARGIVKERTCHKPSKNHPWRRFPLNNNKTYAL